MYVLCECCGWPHFRFGLPEVAVHIPGLPQLHSRVTNNLTAESNKTTLRVQKSVRLFLLQNF